MKKMNNKGFAVSTLLYSLSIMGFLIVSVMVSIMSLNRINTKSLVKQVEDELNRYSLTETTFRADESNEVTGQEFIVPQGESGYYKIELWGAQGGKKGSYAGGRGAYTSGTVYLNENEKLYFYIGQKPDDGTNNGGANGGSGGNTNIAPGGGSTDVRLIEESGLSFDNSSKITRIMVAAGGGGGSNDRKGGDGGTLTGIKYYDQPQSAGAATQKVNNSAGSFLFSSSKPGAGGGYTAGNEQEGGSSYIAGYAGVNSFTRDNLAADAAPTQKGDTIYHFYAKNDPEDLEYVHVRDYNFYNGIMLHAVQEGDGYATIRKVSSAPKTTIPPVKTSYLNNITTIEDCVTAVEHKTFSINPTTKKVEVTKELTNKIKWPEIQLIDKNGINILKKSGVTANATTGTISNPTNVIDGDLTTVAESNDATGQKCITITIPPGISTSTNIELAVYHQPGSSEKHRLTINGSRHIIGDINSDSGTHELYVTGEHISAYSPEYGNPTIPNGNYYIIPVQNRSRVLTTTAQNSAIVSGTTINDETKLKIDKITGSNYQKWYIENIDSDTYKIVESQDYKAMQISTGMYRDGEEISAPYQFVGNPEEKWKFTADQKGRYQIYSTKNSVKGYIRHISGGAVIDTEPIQDSTDFPLYRTYFYLINAEY